MRPDEVRREVPASDGIDEPDRAAGHRTPQDLIDAVRVLRIELRIANDRVAEAAGLNPRDLDVLDVIDREAPCSPGHLAARTGVRAATLTGVLARLESGGWVTRTPDPRDARVALLAPTQRFDELRELYHGGDSAVRELASQLSDTTRDAVTETLVAIADRAREGAATLAKAPGRRTRRTGG